MLRVGDHEELQAAVLAMKAADRDLKRRINQATREKMNPVWQDIVKGNLFGDSVMAGKVLGAGVRIAAGNPPRAMAAQSGKNIGSKPNRRGPSRTGRVIPREHYAMWEFGANRMAYSRYERNNPIRPVRTPGRKSRRTGGTHTVERRVMMHAPRRTPEGRVVYPAFAEIAPRMVSLWVQIIVKSYADAAEGKR